MILLVTVELFQELLLMPKMGHIILNGRNKCDALRDMVVFVQFKKREKHPWRSVNFSKVAG